MRKLTTCGVVLLLLLGLAGGVWLLLNPPDRAAPVGPPVNESAMAPGEASNSLDLPAPAPFANAAPDPGPEPAVDPPIAPAIDPPAETPTPARLLITGRVEDSLTGAPVQNVYVAITSQTDTPWAGSSTYTGDDGTFTLKLPDQPLPADAVLTTWSRGYEPAYQSVAGTNIIRLVRETAVDVPIEGAELLVVVIGPDGLPLSGVDLWAYAPGKKSIRARTGDTGDVLLTGFAAPSSWTVKLLNANGTQCVAEKQVVEFASPADRKEARFDFTGTGIVDYEFTVNGERLRNVSVKAAAETGRPRIPAEWMDPDNDDRKLIYGLSPGKYIVTAAGWVLAAGAGSGGYLEFVGVFEVVQPPAVSTWRRDFKTSTVTVRVNGADGNDLKLRYMSGGVLPVYEVAPQPGGEFVISGLGARALILWVDGDGWASDVVVVYPSMQPEVQVDVVAAGTLTLIPRSTVEYCTLKIVGIEPVRRAVVVQCPRYGHPDAMQLPAGRYSVDGGQGYSAPWDSIEVTVKAGEQAECKYGPEFTSKLQIPQREGRSLAGYTVTLEIDGQTVKADRQDGRNYYSLRFEAEGKLTLRIKGADIEDFEREFEVKRGETVSLEIELKQKQ